MVFVIQELIFLNVFSMGVIALVGILLAPIYLKSYLENILFRKLRSGSSGYTSGIAVSRRSVEVYCGHLTYLLVEG